MYFKGLRYAAYYFALLLLLVYGCKSSNNIVTSGSSPSDLTRSGKFISFTSNRDGGKYNIFLAQVDANGYLAPSGWIYSSNPYNLTQNMISENNKQSNWSPNGRALVFSSKQGNGSEVIFSCFFAANGRIDSTKSLNPKALVDPGNNWDENPQFSPDGMYLVWDRRPEDTAAARDLYIGNVAYDSSGISISNIRAITITPVQDEYDAKWAPKILVKKIAFTFLGSLTATDHNIKIMDPFDTSNSSIFYQPGKNSYPAWAPACNEIIFESDKGNGGYYKIVSLGYPTNNGNPTDIANDAPGTNDRYPTWLPNGNLLAFIKIPDNTHLGNIYIVSTSGGSSRALLTSGGFENSDNLYPAW